MWTVPRRPPFPSAAGPRRGASVDVSEPGERRSADGRLVLPHLWALAPLPAPVNTPWAPRGSPGAATVLKDPLEPPLCLKIHWTHYVIHWITVSTVKVHWRRHWAPRGSTGATTRGPEGLLAPPLCAPRVHWGRHVSVLRVHWAPPLCGPARARRRRRRLGGGRGAPRRARGEGHRALVRTRPSAADLRLSRRHRGRGGGGAGEA